MTDRGAAADGAGRGEANRDGHPAATDSLALSARVEWMRELIDKQRATIARKDAALADVAEQAERHREMWIKQFGVDDEAAVRADSRVTTLVPALHARQVRGAYCRVGGVPTD